mgnify:CR=1 FL=1
MDYSLIIVLALVAIITLSTALIIIALCILKSDKPASPARPLPSLAEIQKMRDIMYPDAMIPPVHDNWDCVKYGKTPEEPKDDLGGYPPEMFEEAAAREKQKDRAVEMGEEMNARGSLFKVEHTDASLMCETCKKQDCEEVADGECYNCFMNREAQQEKHGDISPEDRE